jgi:hypothetical protein
MANFTDNLQYLTQYNPYIQQLPVEEMQQAEMYKQAKYDEGIQKIQTSIDNTAGLDVVRDVDKQYLQSKLNQLGSQLRTVAAGDFSNFQLVNSTMGMTNKIAKDKDVQNAVMSTARYRKEAAAMQKAIDEGKSSQANIYDFNSQASKWMNSNDLKQSFSGRYSQFVDVDKKALEVIKTLHANKVGYDDPYLANKDGKLTVAGAMKRLSVEGISENQIEQALHASLTPDDLHQLQLNAKYQFKDIDSTGLKANITTKYQSALKEIPKELERLNQELTTTRDPQRLDLIKERIERYNKVLGTDGTPGTLAQSYEQRMKLADSNPDTIKFDVYKEGFIDQYANAFKWQTNVQEFVKSPLMEHEEFNARLRFDQQKLKSENYFKQQNLDVSRTNSAIQQERNAIAWAKLAKEYPEQTTKEWTTMGNPTDSKNNAVEYFNKGKEDVNDAISSDNAILLKTGMSQNAINTLLRDWENSQGTAKISAGQKTILERMAKNENYLGALKSFDNKLRNDTYNSVYKANEKELNTVLSKKSSLNLNYNGTTINLTPQEILGIKNAANSSNTESAFLSNKDKHPFVAGQKITFNQAFDLTKLNDRQKRFLEFQRRLNNSNSPQAAQMKSTINKIFTSYNDAAKITEKINDSAHEKYKEKLSLYANAFVPQIKTLPIDGDKLGSTGRNAREYLMQLNQSGNFQDIAGSEGTKPTAISELLSSKNLKSTKAFIEQNGTKYKVVLSNPDLNHPDQVFQLSKDQVKNYFGDNYIVNREQEAQRIVYGNGGTNLTSNPRQSQLQKQFGNFKKISKYQITADLNSKADNPSSYIPTVNIKKKDGRYATFELASLNDNDAGYEQALQQVNSLTDESLITALKLRFPDYDYSQLLISK